MKISMIPNNQVKVIHANKGDTSLRKWNFEPYDSSGEISVADIKDQLVYYTENGGTEQLLPVNTSTPATSYFDGTINYGTDTDVEFTYKQSDYTGQARVKSIKGNTLVWNQLAESSGSSSTNSGITFTNNGDGTWSTSGSSSGGTYKIITANFSVKANHKYLLRGCASGGGSTKYVLEARTTTNTRLSYADEGSGSIFTHTEDATAYLDIRFGYGGTVNMDGLKFIPQVFDLTQMYGSGNEPTIDEFKALFPLPIYSVDNGSLLSFNGTGIKTTGKNLCTRTNQNSNIYNANNLIPIKKGQTIYWGGVWTSSISENRFWSAVYSNPNETNKNNYIVLGVFYSSGNVYSYTSNVDGYFGLAFAGGVSNYSVEKMMISLAPFTFDEYEPYITSTTSLPISTYFPTGMKSAGSGANKVYDELTESKAITRVGTRAYQSGDESDSTVTTDGTNTNYDLATYTEQDIKTASLVCKNIETPCYLSNGELVCDATEELTSESGFFDAKLKLKDSSSVAYSSKFKLHVEDL